MPLQRRKLRAVIFFSAIFLANNVLADTQDIIRSTFRNAVVKVDVSSNTPVIKNGVNICTSQGTGFLVSSSYVATAEHVVQLAPECGQPVIVLKSRRHNVAHLATVVASTDDIALLKVDQSFSQSMCALGLMNSDVYDTAGFRFGIPGELLDPAFLPVTIGEKDSEFSPLVRLTAAPAESGESGGPVVHMFNVVGVLKAKHKQYTGYSFMMVASTLRSLLTRHRALVGGKVCNPVEFHMAPTAVNDTAVLRPPSGLSELSRMKVLAEIATAKPAIAPVAGVRVSENSGYITITASPRQELRRSCVRLWNQVEQCTNQTVFVSAAETAEKTATDIVNDVKSRLWLQFVAESPPPPAEGQAFKWKDVNLQGDWPASDYACTQGTTPAPTLCNPGTRGMVAVCWSNRRTGECGGATEWCTYKNLTLNSPPTGRSPGRVWECVR